MNTATKNTVPAFADSVATVVEKVKQLREASAAQNDIFVAVNELIHDETLFTKAQRPNALKSVNKTLGTKFNMTAIKKAVRPAPEKAIRVDGLTGTADVALAGKPAAEQPADPAGQIAAAAAGTEFTLVGGIAEAASKTPTNSNTTTELNQENTVETLVSINAARQQRAGQEQTSAPAAATDTTAATGQATAADAVPGKLSMAQFNDVLAQIGITTEEQVVDLINRFFANHFALSFSYKSVEEHYKDESHKTKFGTWVGLNEGHTLAFLTFAKSWVTTQAPVAPQGFVEKVATTLRGNRESGFSSGVVAAATAVLGGAAEMAFRGNLTIGSSVGTALGATAGYFAAEATENLMDSETGRYIVAGSIGLVAGGLGSRLGRTVQDSLSTNAYAEEVAQALPELKRPEVVSAPAAGSIAALF